MEENNIRKFAKDLFLNEGYIINFRKDIYPSWDELFQSFEYISMNYLNYSIEYEFEYQKHISEHCYDMSFVLKKDNNPILICPLLVIYKGNSYSIKLYDNLIFPPLVSKYLSNKSIRKILKLYINFLDKLSKKLKIKYWCTVDVFNNKAGISEWHQQIRKINSTMSTTYDLYLNLNQDLESIRSTFRSSTKSLINKSLRIWKLKKMTKFNEKKWNEFKELHYKVHNSRTRTDKTWDIHSKQLNSKKAFFIYLENSEDKIVGGGYFRFSRDECAYQIGVYDRDLFDKPLGHIIQYKAIEEMKNLNLKWYRIGIMFNEFDIPKPSEKELSISYFKRGFSSHIFPRYNFIRKVSNE